MKIVISNDEKNILVAKDLSNMDTGLMGQLLMELELIKMEVLEMYDAE